MSPDALLVIVTVSLVLATVWLVWATIELRELTDVPVLTLVPKQGTKNAFLMNNIGAGPAINIQVDVLKAKYQAGPWYYAPIKIEGDGPPFSFHPTELGFTDGKPVEVRIGYENVHRRTFETTIPLSLTDGILGIPNSSAERYEIKTTRSAKYWGRQVLRIVVATAVMLLLAIPIRGIVVPTSESKTPDSQSLKALESAIDAQLQETTRLDTQATELKTQLGIVSDKADAAGKAGGDAATVVASLTRELARTNDLLTKVVDQTPGGLGGKR